MKEIKVSICWLSICYYPFRDFRAFDVGIQRIIWQPVQDAILDEMIFWDEDLDKENVACHIQFKVRMNDLGNTRAWMELGLINSLYLY